ncbi:hypothetical protein HMPREF9444_00244 [Succinatimonas hippei YIT 12066]|uniref:Uncharacterized protein n=1 Tax=Succinatimonas hippei (strain DSM 22608 / JCM 16073 / KCTC 15190 / YIT 12066) TaxID=762983 RepID=E8LHT1_SUCHY|nr:hypothetical protein HMPREF9444_00244 [Succinatimonas hippei YIT 12066]
MKKHKDCKKVMTIEEMLAGESKNVEFKVERPKDSIKYIKSVVAFANGSGVIFFLAWMI